MEPVLTYLVNAIPEVALAVIFAIIAWRVSKKLTSADNHFATIDDTMNNIKSDISSIKRNLSDVQLFITSRFPSALGTFASKNSPLKLNENGEKLLKECGGMAFIEANQVLLLNKIQERQPKTALDVETWAKEVLLSLTNNDIFNTLKVWVYNSPSWKIDGKDYTITLGDVCFVLSIPLRDKYLSLHPEIAR